MKEMRRQRHENERKKRKKKKEKEKKKNKKRNAHSSSLFVSQFARFQNLNLSTLIEKKKEEIIFLFAHSIGH